MKRNLFTLSVMLCYVALALAVPAKPGWHTVTQSDGSSLQVQAVGNAFNNAILTTDGLTVERGNDGDFYYVSSLTGLTAMRAHDPEYRTPAERAFISAQRSSLTMQTKSYQLPGKKGRLSATGSNASASVPALGERRIPIILVEFQDIKFNHTRDEIIESMLTGSVSVGQYFRDQSNGLYKPMFDVYGIYSLSENREYYGGRTSATKDKGIGWLVTEACQLAAADGVPVWARLNLQVITPMPSGPATGPLMPPSIIRVAAMAPLAQASVTLTSTILPCSTSCTAAATTAGESMASAPLSTSLAIAWVCPTFTTRAATTTMAWVTGTSCAWAAMLTTVILPWVIRPMKRCSWGGCNISLPCPIPTTRYPCGTRKY